MNEVNSIGLLKEERLFIFWLLGNFCTYKCSYCNEEFNDGRYGYHAKENIFNVIKTLPKCHIMFSGGEPTYHPDFETILSERPENSAISVISNGARPIGFWERSIQNLHSVILTFHAEYANIDRFYPVADICRNKLQRINLTMIPELWDKCVNTYEFLIDKGLVVSPKPLVSDFGFKSASLISGYSIKQLDWISSKNNVSEIKTIGFYRKDGSIIKKTTAAEMLANGETNFSNWECYTNLSALYITPNGDAYSTSCKQREYLGSITTGITLPSTPMICKQDFCWCHSDIQPRKIKI